MRADGVIFRREAAAAFASVASYVQWAAFLAASGWSLVDALRRGEGGFVQVPALWAGAVAVWLPFLSALATMRSFSAERASGTIETLLTAPVREAQVVWGKFQAAFLAGGTGLLLALAVPMILLPRLALPLAAAVSPWALAAATATLTMQLALWTAVGLFFSLLWEQPAAAAASALFCCLLVPRAATVATASWFPTLPVTTLGIPARDWAMETADGLIMVTPWVCYGVVAWCLLFLTMRLLEVRQIRTG